MENQKYSGKKGWIKLKAMLLTLGVAFVALVTFLNNSTGVINNLIGIGSFVHAKPTPVTATSRSRVNASPAKPQADKVTRSEAPAKPVTQISVGNNSPNVSGVQGSVRFQSGAQGTPTSPASPGKRSALAKPSTAAATQISTGDGSPNISNVGGDVDLRYSAPTQKE
jgi:hypothetical protein